MTAASADPRARVRDVVDRHRSRPFLIDARTSRVVSYGEFHATASSFAGELRRRGVGKGDRVALALPNAIEFAAMYFACLYRGAVAAPINLAASAPEIAFVLSHAGLRLIVATRETEARLPDARELEVPIWRMEASDISVAMSHGHEAPECEGDVRPDDLLSLTFTSGTTGQPKGVAHRIGSLLDAAAAFASAVELDERTCMAHVLPMCYMAGFLNTLLCPFMIGASVVLCRPFDNMTALSFWGPLMPHGVDALWLTPSMAAALLRVDRSEEGRRYCREHVRTVCIGTAPLPPDVKRQFEAKYGVAVLESYGLSELLFVATERPRAATPGSVGPPLAGVEVEIRQVGADEAGEIWVRTPYLMQGYLNHDTQTPDGLSPDHWFDTGDLGRVQPDGALTITGRTKDLIIRGGVNISPRAVEDALMGHPAIQHAAVIGLPDPLLGERVAAVVVLKSGESLEAVRPSIESLCRARLSAAAVPSAFVAVDRLPTGVSGKVQKHILREELCRESLI